MSNKSNEKNCDDIAISISLQGFWATIEESFKFENSFETTDGSLNGYEFHRPENLQPQRLKAVRAGRRRGFVHGAEDHGQDAPSPASDSSVEPEVVQESERYRILEKIGEGGMGAVYKAEDLRLGKRLVALKRILAQEQENKLGIEWFWKEADAIAQLDDEKAKKQDGEWFIIEMQVVMVDYYPQRLLYYWARVTATTCVRNADFFLYSLLAFAKLG